MTTQSPLNATQSPQDSPLEATDSHKQTDSLSSPSKYIPQAVSETKPSPSPQDAAKSIAQDSFPPLPVQRINESGCDDAKKGKAKKRKGKKRKARKPGKAGHSFVLHGLINTESGYVVEDRTLTSQSTGRETPTGEEGVGRVGPDRIGLHWQANKNVDQKGPALEAQPIEGVEDVPLDEVQTRAAAYAKVKAVWEKAGDVCVRVYARPLNPRLVLVEWEGEDGVEKHGRIVVGEKQRGMFGPGKVVWVRGPLIGDKWALAGKYNFLGNRVS